MHRYNLYCTEAQTRKALELGAPIGVIPDGLFIPTAEQMINWLEEQEEISDLHIFKPGIHWSFDFYASNGEGEN